MNGEDVKTPIEEFCERLATLSSSLRAHGFPHWAREVMTAAEMLEYVRNMLDYDGIEFIDGPAERWKLNELAANL